MAVFQEPTQWDHELGNNADVSTLPDDTSATTGVASLQKLFQLINQTPLEAGGVAPEREDINALFKYLGDQIFYTQNGGVPSYNATYDYIAGRVVLYNGNLYKCIQANGASSTVVSPDSDDTYWQQLDKPSSALLPNQLVISPVPMTEANLHLLDGALLSGSGAYADYVTMMGELYTADPTATCWTDEATWQASVTTYGECGKFVYDSVNNTLRLPKLKSFIQATTTANELGTLVEAGAPNITASVSIREASPFTYSTLSGAFTGSASIKNAPGGSVAVTSVEPFAFDASLSNSIYGNSNTIQPQSIKYYFYIVVGTVSKTDIQIDIDNVMADLALKADTDLTNATPTSAFAIAMNSANIRTVVETYQSGHSWYRKYSDGWVEQGGLISPTTDQVLTTNLIVTMRDTNYTILGNMRYAGTETGSFSYLNIWDATTTSFKNRISASSQGFDWYVCGYSA